MTEEHAEHWRTLRESFEPRIQRLEAELRGFRWEQFGGVGQGSRTDRSYERLLRLRRLHAKLGSRERLSGRIATAPPHSGARSA